MSCCVDVLVSLALATSLGAAQTLWLRFVAFNSTSPDCRLELAFLCTKMGRMRLTCKSHSQSSLAICADVRADAAGVRPWPTKDIFQMPQIYSSSVSFLMRLMMC